MEEFGPPELRRHELGSIFSDVQVSLLSDMVIVGLGVRKSSEFQGSARNVLTAAVIDHVAMLSIFRAVSRITYEAGLEEPILKYRGVVTFGDHIIDDRFLIGPAIDEAAAHTDLSDAACIWLAPTAMDRWGSVEPGDNPFLVKYEVMLKGAGTLPTWAVNPFGSDDVSKAEAESWTQRVLESFDGPSARVRILREESRRFFEAAMSNMS